MLRLRRWRGKPVLSLSKGSARTVEGYRGSVRPERSAAKSKG